MQSSNTIPIAIVIAGVLIAGSIIYVERGGSFKNDDPINQNDQNSKELSIRQPSQDDHIIGELNAPITFIEYSDTECPFCKRFHETMNNIVNQTENKGKVAWVYRHLPLKELHPKAYMESVATECAYKQGGNKAFWSYINEVYARTPSNNKLADSELTKIATDLNLDVKSFDACRNSSEFDKKVDADIDEAYRIVGEGGIGTPFTVAIMKRDLLLTEKEALQSAFNEIGAGDYIEFTKDPRTFILTGAMPLDLMEKIVEITTK